VISFAALSLATEAGASLWRLDTLVARPKRASAEGRLRRLLVVVSGRLGRMLRLWLPR
jgi:hypothetical protein